MPAAGPPPLALTMGEPAGVGGELTLMAWAARREAALPVFAAFDDPARLKALAAALKLDVPVRIISGMAEAADVFNQALPVMPVTLAAPVKAGTPGPANAGAVTGSIDAAVNAALSGAASGVVTNPIQKSVLYEAGFKDPGHTEYLARLSGPGVRPVMMLAGPELRTVPVTIHQPLAEAAASLTTEMIIAAGRTLHEALKRDFGVKAPVIAAAGLNPHAGEAGTLGREDETVIRPAVEALNAEGFDVRGPMPADTMFSARARAEYDAALCMYHDQALIPVKTLDMDNTVNVTLGLPFVRTSPDHGTALDIAGTGRASPAGLIAALKLAAQLAERRRAAAP
ncbi:MAG: 4-hydroxythreonine-4-phosphate dehydrogenase PdxA [Rhodospirillales bacterium]